MEFLRFGSSIPGGYWGCCAVCIIQNFKVDPNDKASIQLVSGDSGTPLFKGNDMVFAGPTYHDIFKQRIRIGTFGTEDMPNHAFFAVLTSQQVNGGVGAKWLKILKEEGFEFIRTVDNSVYTGPSVLPKGSKVGKTSSHENYIFGLFRNIGNGAVKDQFTPPKAWTELQPAVPEPWAYLAGAKDTEELTSEIRDIHLDLWEKSGPTKLLTEQEVVAAGAPVTMAGLRSQYPPQSKDQREKLQKAAKAKTPSSTAFPAPAAPSPEKGDILTAAA